MCSWGKTVGTVAETNKTVTADDVMNGTTMTVTTAKPDMSSDDVTMVTLSPKRHLLIDNQTLTNSTSVNITGLDHFTEYLVKV